MKYVNGFNVLVVTLVVLPLIVLLFHPEIFTLRLETIIDAISTLLGTYLLLLLFGLDNVLFETEKLKMYTFPLLIIIVVVEIVLFFLINSLLFNQKFDLMIDSLTSIVMIYFFYLLFGGSYFLIKPIKKESKNKKQELVEEN